MLKSQSPDGNLTSYKYDAKGRLITATSNGKNGGILRNDKYVYDPKGRLIRLEKLVDNYKAILSYEYDEKNQLVRAVEKSKTASNPSEIITNYTYNEKVYQKKR